MSYDFRLFLPEPGVDPIVTAQAEADEDSVDLNSGLPVPAKEARKQSIATTLMKANPVLEVFPFDYQEIAKFQRITVEEAKLRFRHLELNGPDDGPGIQITLFDDEASLTVPYWHKGKKAPAVFAEIWQYLQVMQKVAGYKIYDPQMDCIIDLAKDQEKVIRCYTEVVEGLG